MLSFFVILLMTGNQPADPDRYSWTSAILNIFMLHAWVPSHTLSWNFVSWSISAEWFAYLILFSFVLTTWRKLSQFSRAVIVLAFFHLHASHLLDAYISERLVRMSFDFLFGTWIFHWLPSLKNVSQSFWRACLVLIPALVLALILGGGSYDLSPLIQLLWGPMILSLFFERGLSDKILANRLMMRIGTISFSTYLIHGLVAKFLFQVDASQLPLIESLRSVPPFVMMTLFVGMTLCASDLTHRYFEVPARDWLVQRIDLRLEDFRSRLEYQLAAIRGLARGARSLATVLTLTCFAYMNRVIDIFDNR